MLGSGHRMGGDEMHMGRQMRRHVLDDCGFDRPDIGDDRALPEVRANLRRDRTARADRDADDNKIGPLGGLRVGGNHLIGDAKLDDPFARRLRAGSRHDGARDTACARRACDR